MFAKRLLSGIILVICAVFLVTRGGLPLYAATVLIAIRGLFELYRVLNIEKTPLGFVGYLTAISYYGLVWFDGHRFVTLMVIAALMVLMSIYVFTFPRYRTEEVALAFFGVFYVAVMLSYLYQVRAMPDGKYLVWMIFLSSWGSDTSAYCTGRLFGRHRLANALSPKKTIEGAIGGVVGAMLLGWGFAAVFGTGMKEINNPRIACMLACGIAAVISQIGDLAASAIKRNHNIKDYGSLIPGHGGILDRFDSMLFTAPAVYFAIMFLR